MMRERYQNAKIDRDVIKVLSHTPKFWRKKNKTKEASFKKVKKGGKQQALGSRELAETDWIRSLESADLCTRSLQL